MLLAIDLHEDLVDEEGITISPVLPLQTPGIFRTKLDAPKPDGFITDSNAAFSQQIFDISVTEIESIVEPHGVADDVRRKSVSFISIHGAILTRRAT